MQSFFIGIAGPSGAGKSLFCRHFQKRYANISRLKFDDFFKDLEDVTNIGESKDWDNPSSIKWNELLQAACDLKSGRYAVVPNYSRMHDRMIGEKCVFPAPIMLVDGFMTLVNEKLRELIDLSIFFDLSRDSQITRRRERQPWVKDHYLHNVMLPNAKKYIMPSKQHADIVIDAEPAIIDVHDACFSAIESAIAQRETVELSHVPWRYRHEEAVK